MDINYRRKMYHRNDRLLHRGFDWRGLIFRKSCSSSLFVEEKKIYHILALERMLNFILDYIKMIKKTYMWVYPKYFRDFN